MANLKDYTRGTLVHWAGCNRCKLFSTAYECGLFENEDELAEYIIECYYLGVRIPRSFRKYVNKREALKINVSYWDMIGKALDLAPCMEESDDFNSILPLL